MRNFKFVLEQPFLTPHSTSITYQRPVTADDAVAGYNDGDMIFTVGTGGGADDFGVAKPLGKVHIADGFAIRDFQQFTPDPFLKIGAFLVYR